MARIGKKVNIEDPIYALDKNKGYVRIPVFNGDVKYITIGNLKFKNRYAYDHNIFELQIENKIYRLNKDELLAGLQYV